jgi:hypothetical protein
MSEPPFDDDQHRISRRMVIATAAALAVPIAGYGDAVSQDATKVARMPDTKSTWHKGAILKRGPPTVTGLPGSAA